MLAFVVTAIPADVPSVLVGRLGPLGVGRETAQVPDAELGRHVPNDFGAHLQWVGQERPKEPDGAERHREADAMGVGATLVDQVEVPSSKRK
jgi:hypothetical protein